MDANKSTDYKYHIMQLDFWLFCKVGFVSQLLCDLQMCQNVRGLLGVAVTLRTAE